MIQILPLADIMHEEVLVEDGFASKFGDLNLLSMKRISPLLRKVAFVNSKNNLHLLHN